MFGLVGESGCGKSTTGRCILRLVEPTAGEVRFRGENVLAFPRERMRRARRDMQIVFQDPYSSLNPRMRVRDIVEEPLVIHKLGSREERRARVEELFDLVGLERGAPRSVSARVQRRPAPAHRHRARTGAAPGAHRRRRSRVGARRVDSGAGGEAAPGSAGTAQADLSLHRPRPAPGGAHLPPRGGDVSRPDRRDGRDAARCSPAPRTPIPGRCSARFRCWTRTRRGGASSWTRRRSPSARHSAR